MPNLALDNRYLAELPADPLADGAVREVLGATYSQVAPTPVAAPRLLIASREAAALLDLRVAQLAEPTWTAVLAGNALLPASQAWAANYGGHQFGQWAGQLGDGRAISLGEAVNAKGERWELQLKGAGPTPYSRGADGRAVLRSSIREFLCSEAMHHLGVPTTRALSLVGTGESVWRDMFYDGHPQQEPGAIVCRLAPSFIRFGHFELPASRGEVALLRQLADFTMRRDFPELHAAGRGQAGLIDWFNEVVRRSAVLIAHWMRLGFVHGVMNTDNMSILGLTLDYGPYGWLDDYDPRWTPNTTDAQRRRYRYEQQPAVMYWNLSRLAQALSPLFEPIEPLKVALESFIPQWQALDQANTQAKLGLTHGQLEDAALMANALALLQQYELDFSLFFRRLADVEANAPGSPERFAEAAYDPAKWQAGQSALADWLARYAVRLSAESRPHQARRAAMNQANPCYIPRNYLVQQAIDRAEQGDLSEVEKLLALARHPYEERSGLAAYSARRPDWARVRAGCSMLSCSS